MTTCALTTSSGFACATVLNHTARAAADGLFTGFSGHWSHIWIVAIMPGIAAAIAIAMVFLNSDRSAAPGREMLRHGYHGFRNRLFTVKRISVCDY
jgi:hypothetical protein